MLRTILLAGAVSLAATAAHASITWSAAPGLGTSPAAINFDGPMPAGVTLTFTGNSGLRTGSVAGQYVAPEGDATQYASVGTGGTATLSFASPQRKAEVDLSTVDLYNTFAFYNGATLVGSVAGGQINPNAGTDNPRPTYHADISADQNWNTLVASSSGCCNEFDNVNTQPAASNVPEPSTLAILGLGLTGIGFATRKRSASVARG